MRGSTPPGPLVPPRRRELAAAGLGSLAISGALQASFPQIIGSDGFFHIAQAARVFSNDMPWMPHSVFADGWVDHQLTFHLLLWPLTLVLPLVTAAKVGTALFGGLAIFSTWLYARRGGMPSAVLLALLPVALGWLYWLRLEMPRTQALSLILLLASLDTLRSGRPRRLLLVAAIFAWTYHVALILLPVSAGWAGVQALRERSRRPLRLPLWAAAGLALGWTVHPHSPRTWRFLYQHVVLKVLNQDALPVGLEWRDGGVEALLRHGWGAGLALGLAAVALVRARRRSTEGIALFGLAATSTALILVGTKFVEYALPLSFLAAGAAARDAGWALNRPGRRVLGALCAAGLLASGWTVRTAVEQTEPDPQRLAPAIQALRQVAEPGEVIYHFSWNDFPELVLHGPEFRYIVGLDPHFLALHDPRRWDLYQRIGGAFQGLRSEAIARDFGAHWAILVLPYPGAEDALAQDPGMQRIWSDRSAVLYRVTPPR